MTHEVIISLASNRFQKTNLSKARRCLEEILSDLQFTEECWTEPVGGHQAMEEEACQSKNVARRDAYLNQLAKGTTEMDEAALSAWLKKTEQHFGRNEAKRRFGIVPIDLDLLLYDGEKRHQRDWQRNYIKQLIAQFTVVS